MGYVSDAVDLLDIKPGGLDFSCHFPVLSDGNAFSVRCNLAIAKYDTLTEFEVLRSGSNLDLRVSAYTPVSGYWRVVESILAVNEAGRAHDLKLSWVNQFLSVYLDEAHVHTFSFAYAKWPNKVSVGISARDTNSGAIALTNLRLSEFYAWREAAYVEMDASGSGAISGIIQERPVEVIPRANGALAFAMHHTRPQVHLGADQIDSHVVTEQDVSSAASDVIIYYQNVAAITDTNYADRYGFRTRIYRLSNLDSDAIQSARKILSTSIQSTERHQISLPRADLRIEIGDQVHYDYITSGTQRREQGSIIVESTELEFTNQGGPQARMTISGRKAT